ncbi:MAG: transcriptional regulator [Chlamydiae bacterium RIFCSPHIGHO2_12_FULL_49_9]|nr:MAG: transcriptional regulator [Chlamydiae bacterium RIFCSPHIGHO2_12_FULL_49_9]
MPIEIHLDLFLLKRKKRSKELAEEIGITEQNLSILKTGKAKALRFSTLEAICKALQCQPGDILRFEEEKSQQVFFTSKLRS